MGLQLRGLGYHVTIALDPAQALSLWAGLPRCPSLLVTHLMMPGIRGTDLVRELRKRAPRLPVLFVTGYAADPDALGALPKPWSLLGKPFSREALASAVAAALSSNRSPEPSE
jgi:CheY-like chemotaxis protein